MNLKKLCTLAFCFYGLHSKLVIADGLSHNEVMIVSNLIGAATLQTEDRFETGDLPWGSPSFDKLTAILTDQHAVNLTRLLDVCKTSDQRRVLICAFQGKTPSLYMTVLEKGLEAFADGKLDMQNLTDLLTPRGSLAGIVAYNYQRPRMVQCLSALKSKLEASNPHNDDEKELKTGLLEAIQPIQSGLARTAFLEDRKMYDNPAPLPALP